MTNFDDEFLMINFLNKRHLNIKFTIEKQINHSITFLEVSIIKIALFKHITNRPIQTFSKF